MVIGDFTGTQSSSIAVPYQQNGSEEVLSFVLNNDSSAFDLSFRVVDNVLSQELQSPWVVASRDLNGDGRNDLVIVNTFPIIFLFCKTFYKSYTKGA